MQQMLTQLAVTSRNAEVLRGWRFCHSRAAILSREDLRELAVRNFSSNSEDAAFAVHVKPRVQNARKRKVPHIAGGIS